VLKTVNLFLDPLATGRDIADRTLMLDVKLTILIAEDNDDDVRILQSALKKAGLTNPVQICRDGQDVIHYLKAEGPYADRTRFPFPRLMILDIKMPKLTGFDVLRWLRGHPDCSVIPCIVFSSSSEERDVIEAYRLGANAYFTKPGGYDELAAMFKLINDFWSIASLPPVVEKC
jgi:CheY-like chemotaxis protein